MINPRAVATDGEDQRRRTLPQRFPMVLRFQSLEVERTRKMKEIGGEAPPYIEGNPSTAFAARLIPQYESHIRVTKEIIQSVVNLTKEIPHSNRVTKERTPKLSQHVSHQGTVTVTLSAPDFCYS